jgi:xylulokinase
MSQAAVIGVDIGTGGVRAAIFTATGRRLAVATVPSRLLRPAPGVIEEDPDDQLNHTITAVRQAMRQTTLSRHDVVGLAISGQMAGVIGVGREGRHVTPYDSWLDTRCAAQARAMQRQSGGRIVAAAGAGPSFNHGPKIVWWAGQRRSAYRRIAAFVQPAGYAAMRLCGLDAAGAFLDWSYLHFCAFVDNRRLRWNAARCEQWGVDVAKLPRIVAPTQQVGILTGELARRCGLASGTPVFAGCGDTIASFLAAGAVESGMAVDVAGTASVFAATIDRFMPDRRRQTMACSRSAVEGLWHSYAYIAGDGMNVEWSAKLLGKSVAELDRRAAAIEPAEDLPMFVPHLSGRVCPHQPGMRGSWSGLSWNHAPAHLYRAVLESVALEYALYRDVVDAGRERVRELLVIGGGGRSALWNQIKADVLGVVVRPVAEVEGAPRGAAMVAAVGAGLERDLPTLVRRWVRPGKALAPRPQFADLYRDRVHRYRRLLQSLDPDRRPC